MNRTKRIILSLPALLCCIIATARTSVTKGEYWLDMQSDSRQAFALTDGIWNIGLDVSDLSPGLHSLALRTGTDDGRWSAVMTRHFIVPQSGSAGGNALAGYEYWVDSKVAERVSGTFSEGGVIDLDLDLAVLTSGLHSISFRALDGNGGASPVMTRHFIVPQSGSGIENALAGYEYWLDSRICERVSGAFSEGGIIDLDLNMAALAPGLHSISFRALDGNGGVSPVMVKHFIVPDDEGADNIVAYEYWFNDRPRKRVSVEAGQAVIIDDDIDIAGEEPEKVLENYRFDAAGRQVIYTHDVLFGLQAFNGAGVGTTAVVDTLKDYETVLDVPFVTLALEKVNRVPSPTGCLLQGYQFSCQPEDRVYWFVKAGSRYIDFYDAAGNPLAAMTETVGAENALVITAPTDTIYALAYGAAESDTVDVIRVAQPVEIVFNDSGRTYGDENPVFTWQTARPDLLVGIPVGRTDAVATSAVGSYVITLDSASLVNTMVSVTNGTLTIGKATAVITANDVEVRQDEEMPELSWTVEGLKNGETADDVFIVQPVCRTDGTPDSPLGYYVINVGGAEAENYDFVYVAGTLTVSVSSGISDIIDVVPYDIYNLQGVKVRDRSDSLDGLPAGIYIMNRQKVYIGR